MAQARRPALIPASCRGCLVPVPLWVGLINSTCFFVLVSGPMIVGMAVISAVAPSQVRGTYMSLISIAPRSKAL